MASLWDIIASLPKLAGYGQPQPGDPGQPGLDPNAPQAAPNPLASNPEPQPPAPTVRGLAIAPPDGASATASLPQSAPGAVPQATGIAATLPQQPPVAPVHSKLANFLDKNLLGGAISTQDQQRLAQQQSAYQTAIMRNFAASLPDDKTRAAFMANPSAFITAWDENLKQVALKPGDSLVATGNPGAAVVAPQLDPVSGQTVKAAFDGSQTLSGNAAPGEYRADNGLIVNSRSGVAGTYSQPQQVPFTSKHGDYTPIVTPTGGLPQPAAPPIAATLPQVGQGAPSPVPSVAELQARLPGATVTSGLRTPQHNAAVGGVPGSWHTTGTAAAPGAIDVTPPAGVAMPAFAGQVSAAAPGARVLNEGNHVHIQPNASNTGGPMGLPQTGQGGQPTGWNIAPGKQIYSPKSWNPVTNRYEQTNTATGQVEGAGDGAAEAAFATNQATDASKSLSSDMDARGSALTDLSNAKQALAYVQAHPGDMNPATPHLVAGANYLRTLPPAVLKGVGVDPAKIDQYANSAGVYQRLSSQNLLSFSKSNLPSRYTEREMAVAGKVIPQLSTAPDAASFHWGLQAAMAHKAIQRAEFAANYNGPKSKQGIEHAWTASAPGQASLFEDPVWQGVQIGGKPAVVYTRDPKSGRPVGVVGMGTSAPTTFFAAGQ